MQSSLKYHGSLKATWPHLLDLPRGLFCELVGFLIFLKQKNPLVMHAGLLTVTAKLRTQLLILVRIRAAPEPKSALWKEISSAGVRIESYI